MRLIFADGPAEARTWTDNAGLRLMGQGHSIAAPTCCGVRERVSIPARPADVTLQQSI